MYIVAQHRISDPARFGLSARRGLEPQHSTRPRHDK